MDWTKIIETLGVFGISALSITSGIVYLFKKIIEQNFHVKFEEAKQSLVNDSEILKANLLKNATEYQIKISHLHKERTDAIKCLYSKMAELNNSVYFLVIAGSGNEKIDEMYKLYYELRFEFLKNKILYDKELSALVLSAINKIHESLFNYRNITELNNNTNTQSLDYDTVEYQNRVKREWWDKALKIIQHEVPELLDKLEIEFRSLLGVVDSKSN